MSIGMFVPKGADIFYFSSMKIASSKLGLTHRYGTHKDTDLWEEIPSLKGGRDLNFIRHRFQPIVLLVLKYNNNSA